MSAFTKSRVTSPIIRHVSHDRGNVLFIILMGVILFAALSLAVRQYFRSDGKNASQEVATINAAKQEGYVSLIQNVALRMQTVSGCTTIDYTPPASQSPTGSKTCFMFHPDGGNVPYVDYGIDTCTLSGTDITTLSSGQTCGGMIFVGYYGGNYLFTNAANNGQMPYKGNPYNLDTNAESATDGLANTNILMALGGYAAATSCRSLGEDWYLPARGELQLLASVKNNGALAGTLPLDDFYWSSTQSANHAAERVNMTSGGSGAATKNNSTYYVRCYVRISP